MNEYKFECPNCGQHLAIPAEMAGQSFECPTCGQTLEFEIPVPTAEPKPQGASDSAGAGDGGQSAPTNGEEPSVEIPVKEVGGKAVQSEGKESSVESSAAEAPSEQSSPKSKRWKARIDHLKQRLRAACRVAAPWLARLAKRAGKLAANGFSKAVSMWKGFDRKTRKRVGIAVAAVGIVLIGVSVFPFGDKKNGSKPVKAKGDAFHSEEEIDAYIEKCEAVSWNDVMRHPDRYVGKDMVVYCRLRENEREGFFFDTEDKADNRWMIQGSVSRKLRLRPSRPDGRFLAGDEIVVFGRLRDIWEGKTVLGAALQMPRIDALYIVFGNNKSDVLSAREKAREMADAARNCRAVSLADGTSVEIRAVSQWLWMGKTEVTQKLWESVMGQNPSGNQGDDLPVENVSWNDCKAFLKKFNALREVKKSGFSFRLPSQEEWEVACLGNGPGPLGTLPDGENLTESSLGDTAWMEENASGQTHPVGQKKSNSYGLHDMNGNVCEWTETADGDKQVFCGGAYLLPKDNCAANFHFSAEADARNPFVGFRLCANPKK